MTIILYSSDISFPPASFPFVLGITNVGAIKGGFICSHFSVPLILAPSPTLRPVPPGREGPHLLLYFSPVSNYKLTLVIYITSSVPKQAGSAGAAVPAARQVASAARLAPEVQASPAASPRPMETQSQASPSGTGPGTRRREEIGDGPAGRPSCTAPALPLRSPLRL